MVIMLVEEAEALMTIHLQSVVLVAGDKVEPQEEQILSLVFLTLVLEAEAVVVETLLVLVMVDQVLLLLGMRNRVL
jgi:hypothetical protein